MALDMQQPIQQPASPSMPAGNPQMLMQPGMPEQKKSKWWFWMLIVVVVLLAGYAAYTYL